MSDARVSETTAVADAGEKADGTREPPVSLSALGAAGLSASCCLLPLTLVRMGLGGVWIGSLAAHKPWPARGFGGVLAFGFHRAYGRRAVCTAGGASA